MSSCWLLNIAQFISWPLAVSCLPEQNPGEYVSEWGRADPMFKTVMVGLRICIAFILHGCVPVNMGARPLTELLLWPLCAPCLSWVNTCDNSCIHTSLFSKALGQVCYPHEHALHPSSCPVNMASPCRYPLCSSLSWRLRKRLPRRHTWRNNRSRTRLSFPPAVCGVAKSLPTIPTPVSQPECG